MYFLSFLNKTTCARHLSSYMGQVAYSFFYFNTSQYPTMVKKESDKGGGPVTPELLAPAGNLEKLITAIHYGADAVYFGGKEFSLRAKAGNFSREDMEKGAEYAHTNQAKVYVTVNILAHNRDLTGLDKYLYSLRDIGVDGLIISDPGILEKAKEYVPELPIHLSTQANVTNHASANFWSKQGAVRLNLARELSLEEIKEIKRKCNAEVEVFVHGALCISYSGRCMLSNYMTDRDANKGHCSHPCRYSYALIEEKRPGQYYPVEEDERGTYIFNSKDLCLLQVLPELIAAGVDAIKIEGRMKSIFYVGGVVRVYRAALDYLKTLPSEAWKYPERIRLPNDLMDEIEKTGTRGATDNFIRQPPGREEMLYASSRAVQFVEPVAVIRETGPRLLVEVRNTLMNGERLEYMERGIAVKSCMLNKMYDEKGETLTKAHPGNRVFLVTEPELISLEVNGIIRREI